MYVSMAKRIEQHRKYWNLEKVDHPIVSVGIHSDYFFATHFKGAEKLLIPGRILSPEDLVVEEYFDDYKRFYEDAEATGHNAVYAVKPFVAVPWMEAMCGCPVIATDRSFVSKPYLESALEYNKITFDTENPWYKKYIEYIEKLGAFFGRNVPVCQSLNRGIADVLGAVLGQVDMVYNFFDYPNEMQLLAERILNVFLMLQEGMFEVIEPFEGGYCNGYNLWVPGRSINFQDDLMSLISPALYREFILPYHKEICNKYDYSSVHLHSTSLHLLDDILSIKGLNAIQIQKDIGGATIEELLPVFKRVQKCKRQLIISGDITKDDVSILKTSIENRGLHLCITVPYIEQGKQIVEYIYNW